MDKQSSEHQVQKMISIINQIPIGLVETNLEGAIVQMNAKGVQLLMPLFMLLEVSGASMFELLSIIAPELVERINQFKESSGSIVHKENHKIEINRNGHNLVKYFYHSIYKVDENTISFVFDDITELQEKENQIREALQAKAIEQSKFEMASGILHDIGNAVVGFGSYINRIKRHLTQTDFDKLKSLHGFLGKNQQQFETAIGEAKTKAMMDMIGGIAENEQKNAKEAESIISEQMGIIAHISEILTIQRQYIKGQQSTDREQVNLRTVINDSIAMILPSLTKKDIEINMDIPLKLPMIKGDKTRLMQVFLNVFKNAAESIASFESSSKKISIVVIPLNNQLVVNITDTGKGFDAHIAENLFSRGFTSKDSGTGLGLINCKSIIESHNGQFEIKSDGFEKGAMVTITLKI